MFFKTHYWNKYIYKYLSYRYASINHIAPAVCKPGPYGVHEEECGFAGGMCLPKPFKQKHIPRLDCMHNLQSMGPRYLYRCGSQQLHWEGRLPLWLPLSERWSGPIIEVSELN